MDYIKRFRNQQLLHQLIQDIGQRTTKQWRIMEVCGGQTHSIIKFGLDELLKQHVQFLHGPGCPVCVTSLEMIDIAQRISTQENVVLCTFGDMLRVPGTHGNLLDLKAQGSEIKVIYSPLDAVKIAQKYPDKEVVLFAIGFETTAPANAMALRQANKLQLQNFSAIVSHMLTPPIIASIMQSQACHIDGFLAPGHVCAITGYEAYKQIADIYQVPMVVTGFEPVDILQGVLALVGALEDANFSVINQYKRSVELSGNKKSQALLDEVFDVCDQTWRGIGVIPKSGYRLSYEYRRYDAIGKFAVDDIHVTEPKICISGEVLKGVKKPYECAAFGKQCTPDHPIGSPMVSSEGACAAYYHYKSCQNDLEISLETVSD